MKIVHFLLETGCKPIIPASPVVRNEFESAEEVVQMALNQKITVTDEINNIMRIADEEDDYTTQSFLQWFVNEQVEEVDTMTNLLQTIRHAGGNLLWVEDYVRRYPRARRAVCCPCHALAARSLPLYIVLHVQRDQIRPPQP